MIKGRVAIAIALLAAFAIIVGLVLTGGPAQARKERRDRQRESDIAHLSRLVGCLARENGNRLPEELQITPQCDWQVQLADPFTGEPYRYEVTGPRSYRLCADFELLPDHPSGLAVRDEQGCTSRFFIPTGAERHGIRLAPTSRG